MGTSSGAFKFTIRKRPRPTVDTDEEEEEIPEENEGEEEQQTTPEGKISRSLDYIIQPDRAIADC